ncbi:hypothetical protein [Oceanobacillus salinisoli]|uniref:hypothetical protein n=1 Tax=Oceanobacillus salinisoli TaxID=2678611 RepID=UPI0012E1EDED|nr:hypothetical protein [Oceanobacillus salinisoli]
MDSQFQTYTKSQIDFINKQLQAAARMAARTEKEILSIFTDDEINLVKEAWSRSKSSNGMSFKNRLINCVVDETAEEFLVTKWNVNKKELLQKVMVLTVYQAFTLIRVSSRRLND